MKTVLGVIVMGVLSNALRLLNIDTYPQMMIEAYVLLSDEGEALATALGWGSDKLGQNIYVKPYHYLLNTQRKWNVVKGNEQTWELAEEEGTRLVRNEQIPDLSGLIRFDDEEARLSSIMAAYSSISCCS